MQRYLQSTFRNATFRGSQPSSLDREADKPRGPGADCPPGKTENLYSLANTAVRFSGSSARPVRRVRRAHYSDFIAAIKSYRLASCTEDDGCTCTSFDQLT